MYERIPTIGPDVTELMFGVTDTPEGSISGQTIRVSFHNGKPVLWMGSGVPAYITDPETLDRLIAALVKAWQKMDKVEGK